MKVFVAGATGVLGAPLVRRLVKDGDEVVGLTRREEGAREIEAMGARAVVANALDREAMIAAVGEAKPEALVHLLTALPKAGPMKASDLKATNELRVKGTENLVAAAKAAGVKRLVAESFVLVYGFGDHGTEKRSEFEELRPATTKVRAEVVEALRALERRMAEANGDEMTAVALRYGLVYGPEAGSTVAMAGMLKKRMAAMPAFEGSRLPFVHVDDAVEATALTLRAERPGEVYNVVDDTPMPMRAFMERMAEAMGTKPPWPMPGWMMKKTMPFAATMMATSLPLANDRAKQDLGWRLKYPETAAGLEATAAAMKG